MGEIINFRIRGRVMEKKNTEQLILDIRHRKYNISETIERLLNFSGIDRIPIDVVRIANDHGFKVYEAPLKDGISGALVDADTPFYENENRVIFVNAKDSNRRQLFTIAHEIAHFCLHCSNHENYYRREVSDKDNINDLNTYREETEADYFAACLLMPASIFKNYFYYIKKIYGNVSREFIIEDICNHFNVEEEAVKQRFDELGIIF